MIDIDEEDCRIFAGKNADYWVARLRELKTSPEKNKFNWAGAFLPVAWLGYRRMYLYAFGASLLITAAYLLGDFMGDLTKPIYSLTSIIFFYAMGSRGNKIYLRHAASRIRKIRGLLSLGNVSRRMARAGGTSWPGSFVMLCLFLAMFVSSGLLFVLTGKQVPLTPLDQAVLITPDEIGEYFEDWKPIRGITQTTKTQYRDGTFDVEMAYTPQPEDEPHIHSVISHTINIKEAIGVFHANWFMMSRHDDPEDILRERNDLFSAGDASRLGFMEVDGETVGMIIIARKGRNVISFSMNGLFIDNPEILRLLFDLSQLADYPIKIGGKAEKWKGL